MGETAIYALAVLLVLNLITFGLFGWDKFRSRGRRPRVSEARLLTHTFFGGFPGAKLGQYFFRHKTRKQPFASRVNRIGWLQAAVFAACLFYVQSDRRFVSDVETLIAWITA